MKSKPQSRAKNREKKVGKNNPPVEYQFKPGRSGNPGGRPKKRPISARYSIFAEVPLPEKIRRKLKLPEGATLGDSGVLGLFLAMAEGKHGAAKEIREGIEGRAPQRIEFSGPDGEEIKAKVDAKLSVGDLLGALRTIYGLSTASETPNGTAASVPVPADVGQRPRPPQDSEKK